MELKRPMVFFDIEGTGTDVAQDRIVELAATKIPAGPAPQVRQARCTAEYCGGLYPLDAVLLRDMKCYECGSPLKLISGLPKGRRWLVNPGFLMSDEVIAVHGITNEMVQDCPKFAEVAADVFLFFEGCDLGGFNINGYDIPLLWEELFRAGLEWKLDGVDVLDASDVFRLKHPRTLSAAVEIYCGRKHENAHSGEADVEATIDVALGQFAIHDDLRAMTLAEIRTATEKDNRLDLAGKIVLKDGMAVYNFGKAKGTAVQHDPGFGQWMLRQDFITQQTKRVVRHLLSGGER